MLPETDVPQPAAERTTEIMVTDLLKHVNCMKRSMLDTSKKQTRTAPMACSNASTFMHFLDLCQSLILQGQALWTCTAAFLDFQHMTCARTAIVTVRF